VLRFGLPAPERRGAAQVLLPASQFIRALVAARLAADVCGVPTVVVARTDAHSASLLTSDIDELDRPFLTGKRTPEGFFGYQHGIKARRPRPPSQTRHAACFHLHAHTFAQTARVVGLFVGGWHARCEQQALALLPV